MFFAPKARRGEATIVLSCYPVSFLIDLAHGGHRPPRSGGRLIILNSAEGMGFTESKGSLPRVSWLHLRFAAAEASVPGRDRITGKLRIQKKAPPEAGP